MRRIPVGQTPLSEAQVAVLRQYHLADLREARVDLDELLASRGLDEALQALQLLGLEPCVEWEEIERLTLAALEDPVQVAIQSGVFW